MPVDWSKYPPDWPVIRRRILDRAGHRCEGSPAFPECRAENYQPHPVTGSRVVLTVAHVNHDTSDNRDENLRAWCQKCHNNHDVRHRAGTRRQKRLERQGNTPLF